MTSTPPSTPRWCLALLLLAHAGTAAAGPETCLTLRDNVAVAQCANQYGPARLPAYAHDRTAEASAPRYAAARPEDVLLAVPVPTQKPPVAQSAEPAPNFASPEHYAFILNGMAVSGIAGFVVLGVVGWIWRLRGASVKRCPFCSARVSANAHVCKSCFRVI